MLNTIAKLRENRGTGTLLVGVHIILFLVLIFALVLDINFLYVRRDMIKDALDASNMAVYSNIDQNRLLNGELYIDPEYGGEGVSDFIYFLEKNLNASYNPDTGFFHPVSPSFICAPFKLVLNKEDIGNEDYVYLEISNIGEGSPEDVLYVYSRARVTVKPIFMGLFNKHVKLSTYMLTDVPFDFRVPDFED